MKKGLILSSLIGLALTKFASAAFYNSGFDFGGFFVNITFSTLILFTLFIIFYALLNQRVFGKLFHGTGAISIISSMLVSFAAVWGLSTIDIESFLYSLVGENLALWIVGALALIGVIFAMRSKNENELRGHFRFSNLMIVLGLFLIGIAFTGLLYESGAALIMGAVIFLLGLILKKRKDRKERGYPYPRTGRGSPSMWGKAKQYADPVYRRDKYLEKEAIRQDKRDARRDIRDINRRNVARFDNQVQKTFAMTPEHRAWRENKRRDRKLRNEQKRKENQYQQSMKMKEEEILRQRKEDEQERLIKQKEAENLRHWNIQKEKRAEQMRKAEAQEREEQERIKRMQEKMDRQAEEELQKQRYAEAKWRKRGEKIGFGAAKTYYGGKESLRSMREARKIAKKQRKEEERIRQDGIARQKALRRKYEEGGY